MLTKLLTLTFTMILISSLQAKETKSSKKIDNNQRWKKILKLVDEEIKTISKVKHKSQKLEYRMFELMSEKVKLYKEKENKQFIAKKLKYGKKITRKEIFKQTLVLYNKANNFGKSLLKKFPNSRYTAGIYYTLALNSRDFSYDKNELKFLRLALESSNTNQQVNYLARTSLAEYYYNIKNWKSAIYQYDQVLSNKDDEWYTKNLLNYGWCKLKSQEFKVAINSLERSFKLSQTDFYVDVQEQTMNGLVSFYVLGKKINRGISFIEKNAQNKNEYLLRLAKKASAKGFFPEANKIVLSLEKSINPKEKQELYADLKLFQFEMYNQYQKTDLLLKTAKEFKTLVFTKYQNNDAVQRLSQVVGAKQVILKKDYSKYNKEYNKKTLLEVIEYFDILSTINTSKAYEYSYFQAETYYSVELYQKAVSKYKDSLKTQPLKKVKTDLREKNLDAIFSCIDLIDYSSSKLKKDKELEFAYATYLGFWPKSAKAQKIYPRLFNLYAKTKNYADMSSALRFYTKSFPKDTKIQQDLFRSQLDLMIRDKNTDLLSQKISLMAKGFLQFKKSEVKKSETILANILFSKFQEMRKSGKNQDALEGYKKVFYRDGYPSSIRGEAAFNMGMIYTDIENNSNAFKWYRKSFKFLNKKEILQKRVYLEKMALRTALLHNFLNAAKLERFIVHSFCQDKESNTKNLKNALKNDLANDYIRRALFTYKKYQKCIPSVSKELKGIKELILDHLFQQKHETQLVSFISENNLQNIFPQKVNSYYERLFWKHYNTSPMKKSKYYNLLKRSKSKEASLLINSFKELANLKKSILQFKSKKVAIPQKDPNPNVFISKLTNRINELKKISNIANGVFSLGHGQISVFAYDELIKVSNDFSSEIESYYLPINDSGFQKQFKDEMNKISQTMKNEAINLKKNSQKMIEDFEVLLVQRKYSDTAFEILNVSDIRIPASTFGVTIGLENDE